MELNQHIFCAKCLQKQKVMLYIQECSGLIVNVEIDANNRGKLRWMLIWFLVN